MRTAHLQEKRYTVGLQQNISTNFLWMIWKAKGRVLMDKTWISTIERSPAPYLLKNCQVIYRLFAIKRYILIRLDMPSAPPTKTNCSDSFKWLAFSQKENIINSSFYCVSHIVVMSMISYADCWFSIQLVVYGMSL